MAEENLDIIVSMTDNASAGFENLDDTVKQTTDDIQNGFDESTQSAEENTDSIEQNTQSYTDNTQSTEENAQAKKENAEAGQEEASSTEEASVATELLSAAMELVVAAGLADTLWKCAEAAGNYNDSVERVNLAMEGIRVNSEEAGKMVTDLADSTGRSWASVRESMIQMQSSGLTNANVMESVFKTASGQAYILGTNVDSVANKYAGLAMRSSLTERALRGTGITIEELGQAMNMQGATIDELKGKWESMTIDQRANVLAQAGALNEGAKAMDEYKDSWQGVNESLNKFLGYATSLVGQFILPVLVPAMQLLTFVLEKLDSGLKMLMNSELGPIISIFVSVGGAVVVAVLAFQALEMIIPLVAGAFTVLSGPVGLVALAIAAVSLAIFELGKSMGWWTDLSTMFDSISAGAQRLWSAFSNNEDLQGLIKAFQDLYIALEPVGQVLLSVMGVTTQTGSQFDLVRAIIDLVGASFHNFAVIITTVVNTLTFLIGCIQNTISFFQWLFGVFEEAPSHAGSMVTGILKFISSLPSKVWSYLTQVGSRIGNAGKNWLSYAKTAGKNILNGVINGIGDIAGAVFGKFKGIAGAIDRASTGAITSAKNFGARALQAFKRAINSASPSDFYKIPEHDFNAIPGIIDNARPKAVNAVSRFGKAIMSAYDDVSFGANTDYNIESTIKTENSMNKGTLEVVCDVIYDFKNLPQGVSAEEVAQIVNQTSTTKEFARNLTSNMSFQNYDLKVKDRLSNKTSRARGA